MKKIMAALLAMTLMFQAFSFVTYAADAALTLNVTEKKVTIEASGFGANEQVSVRGFYNDEDALDYIWQVVADADGNIEHTYGSRAAEWNAGDVLSVSLASATTTATAEATVPGGEVPGDAVNSVDITDEAFIFLRRGEKYQVSVVTDPVGAEVVWTSSSAKATVDENGLVTAVNQGSAMIEVYGFNADGVKVYDKILVQVTM